MLLLDGGLDDQVEAGGGGGDGDPLALADDRCHGAGEVGVLGAVLGVAGGGGGVVGGVPEDGGGVDVVGQVGLHRGGAEGLGESEMGVAGDGGLVEVEVVADRAVLLGHQQRDGGLGGGRGGEHRGEVSELRGVQLGPGSARQEEGLVAHTAHHASNTDPEITRVLLVELETYLHRKSPNPCIGPHPVPPRVPVEVSRVLPSCLSHRSLAGLDPCAQHCLLRVTEDARLWPGPSTGRVGRYAAGGSGGVARCAARSAARSAVLVGVRCAVVPVASGPSLGVDARRWRIGGACGSGVDSAAGRGASGGRCRGGAPLVCTAAGVHERGHHVSLETAHMPMLCLRGAACAVCVQDGAKPLVVPASGCDPARRTRREDAPGT